MSSFTDKLARFVESTCVGLALTLSKDVGILQVLLDARTPLTSHQIADQRGMKERYVRELVDCLATAEVIHASTSDSGCLLYYIDEEEKKAFKTPAMARMSFSVGMMKVYDYLKSCFSKTGPSGFRISTEFYDAIDEYGDCQFDSYVDSLMRCVDGLKAQLESGIDVLEVGCGRGRMLAKLARMFPESSFTASDKVQSLQDWQKTNLSYIPNVKYDMLDLSCPSDLPSKQYDLVYCVNVIHDVPDPLEALKTVRKLTKPGGVFTMIDFATSGSPIGDKGNMLVAFLYSVGTFMSVPESFQREDSQAMGCCWGKQRAVDLATAAGFTVDVVYLEYPVALFICK
ncbi:unnamed protein product [Candidula unifasciata]|uniref:S-adenosylmethionine-dependent methyltransferase Rv2258c-like winged HTH domain-containing protein n=1 Tax=Candidula unifasciata TaxID=100452 RepID=A0A8S3ZV37_9EUPU|nr:unnamed protein product [Candidula unifasciata]